MASVGISAGTICGTSTPTLMLGSGVHPNVVSERLGHASVAITLDTYSHFLPGLQAAAAAQLDAVLAEPVEAVAERSLVSNL